MRNKLRQVVVVSAIGTLGIAAHLPSASAQATDDLSTRVQELEQQLKVLKRQLELDGETSAERAKSAVVVSAGSGGFSIRSADTNFVLKVRGYIQADTRWYANDFEGGTINDTFLMRRVRPIFEGTVFEKYDYRLMLDFGSGATSSSANNAYVQDAYFNARWFPEFQLVGGKMKEPVGLERLQSGANLLFVERGYPTQLVPNRDVGFQFQGDVFKGALSYSVGAFNGVADGGSGDIDTSDDEKDGAARLFTHPFRNTELEAVRDLGIGIAGTYGNQSGALRSFVSPGQQRIFAYSSGVEADGDHWRLTPQGYWYWGPFGLFAEYVVSDQEVVRAADFERVQNTAWQVAGSYVLTGEQNSWRGITPKKPFTFSGPGWGAIELAARYGELDIDDDVFPAFASPDSSATEAKSWAVGVNWHLNRNFKVQVNYEDTKFDGGTTEFLENGEQIVFTRAQVSF
jgi:phosphate-selective porin OprO/OprP